MTAPDDRARGEQPAVWWSPTTGLVQHWDQESEHWIVMPGAELPADAVRLVSQPAPAGGDELREAIDHAIAAWLKTNFALARAGWALPRSDQTGLEWVGHQAIDQLQNLDLRGYAEELMPKILDLFAERGRELERLREENASLRETLEILSDSDTVKAIFEGETDAELTELRARVCELEAGREVEQHMLRAAALQFSELRARDEKAAAVVRAARTITEWARGSGASPQVAELWIALDELARAHEDES